jgi:hypothetical protein
MKAGQVCFTTKAPPYYCATLEELFHSKDMMPDHFSPEEFCNQWRIAGIIADDHRAHCLHMAGWPVMVKLAVPPEIPLASMIGIEFSKEQHPVYRVVDSTPVTMGVPHGHRKTRGSWFMPLGLLVDRLQGDSVSVLLRLSS